MAKQGPIITRDHAYNILEKCEKERNLEGGRRVQWLLVRSGLDSVSSLGDYLIRIFAYHGCLIEANEVFCKIAEPSKYTWAAIIMAHAKLGQGRVAIILHNMMGLSAVKSDNYIFIAVLKACAMMNILSQVRVIHYWISECDLHCNNIVGNSLIDTYAKCRSLDEACAVFYYLPSKDVVSWGTMIAGYAHYGECHLAFQFFERMQEEGIKPNLILWNAIISAYAQSGKGVQALECFQDMKEQGIKPDRVTFLSVLKACACIGAIKEGILIHKEIIESALQSGALDSTLVDMYAKCGNIDAALEVFDAMPEKDVVSWTAMIAGYVQLGQGKLALECFEKMQEEGIKANEVTFSTALKACTLINSITNSKLIHAEVIKKGFQSDHVLRNTLIDMYAKCGDIGEASKTFRRSPGKDVISWGAIIEGYVQHGKASLAIDCFQKMQQNSIKTNEVIFLSILKACGSIGAIYEGRIVHSQVIKNGYQLDICVGNTLLDMYAKCNSLEEADTVFNELHSPNVVSWDAIITGYAQQGDGLMALECFEKMQHKNVEPSRITFLSVLKACASIGALEQGRFIYEYIRRTGLHLDPFLGNILVDMFTKCGNLEEAHNIFNQLPARDVVSWGAIIGGYAQHGKGFQALDHFEQMEQEGVMPDEVLFASVLVACSHAGLVDQGPFYFISMKEYYGLMPNASHITCLVDLLGRAGCLDEALDLLRDTIRTDIVGWTTLLGACRLHGGIQIARHCFEQLVHLNDFNTGGYVLLSNISADLGMLEENTWNE